MNALPLLILLAVCAPSENTTDEAAELAALIEKRYAASACVQCHKDQKDRLKDIYDEWANSVHYENNVACRDCHGGDDTLTREEFTSDEEFTAASHATFSPEYRFLRKRTGPTVDTLPETVASYACRECHTWSTQKGLSNPHAEGSPSDCTFMRFGGVAMSRERAIAYICAP